MDLNHEKGIIKQKYYLADSPTRFINNVIHRFQKKFVDKQTKKPEFLFAGNKKLILVEMKFCISN